MSASFMFPNARPLIRLKWSGACRVLCLAMLTAGFAESARADENSDFFENRIRPALIAHCFKCHGGETDSNGLRVDSLAALTKGGDAGAALIPGKPDESLLFIALSYQNEDLQMPPDNRLPDNVVADFRKWIEAGAVWPNSPASGADPAFQSQRHWAFQPIARPEPPEVNHTGHVSTPVDRFLLKSLEAADIEPSPRADRATLIRRLWIDLLGLPPTYEEVQAFVNDPAADAWKTLVDRALASPQYGERWGRHWLDLSRYADTKGYVFQEERKYPFAYAYRDWVINSLNQDLPYDEFLRRQIAADWLVKDNGLPDTELAAMGFLTLGRRFLNNRHDIIDDRMDVLIRGTMALTIGCARCHDHKYDPIPQADYYSLYGVFASTDEPAGHQGAMPLFESEKPFNPYVFLRGQAHNHGPQVPRQFLKVVSGPDRKPFEKGSGRMELAQSIVSPDNPLTARVMVNRVWRQHFHSPLVATTSDFGLRCDPPTHPELMDWLAGQFIDSGWSLKELHRVILLSSAWQQSSNDDPQKRAADPENRLLWRMNRGRMELEPMRDAVLLVSGHLDPAMGGPSVDISGDQPVPRRSVYGFIDRQNLPSLFRTFDFAIPDTHSPGRFETTVPQQTLYLRNSRFMTDEMNRVAQRLPDGTAEDRLQALFKFVYSRVPTADEVALAMRFIQNSQAQGGPTPLWRYGYGRFDDATGRLATFSDLPHFTGQAWQGGNELPDPKLGWVTLRANSGHPGDTDHSAVYRFTSPVSSRIRIDGELKHPIDQGNGVDILISHSRTGLVARFHARNQSVPTRTDEFDVQAGDIVDLIISNAGDTSHDSFQWSPRIHDVSNPARRWSVQSQFRGPVPGALDAWAQLAQVLVLSNEFQFAD